MKGIHARRIQVRLGEVWKSPSLHILLTAEDNVIVARCLDFTVSSHGDTEKDALHSLGEAIKEYLLSAVEENATDLVYDSGQSKYWRMFNEIEAKTTLGHMRRSLKKSKTLILDNVQELKLYIQYA